MNRFSETLQQEIWQYAFRVVVPGAFRGRSRRKSYEPPPPPSVVDQAMAIGAELRFVEPRLLSSDPQHYNGSLVRDERGIWLVWRNQDRSGNSTIRSALLDDNLKPIPSTITLVALPSRQEADEQWEDPRAFRHNGSTWLSYTSWRNNASWSSIGVSQLNRDWKAIQNIDITYGGNWNNTIFEKNWIFFSHDEKLHFIYQANPHEVINADDVRVFSSPGITWDYGTIRGGTPPILVEDRYVTFFHSSRMEGYRRRYYMGAYTFDAKPPFPPLHMTKTPILAASDKDKNISRLPLVVFPCGAIHEKGRWTVSLGINDLSMALMTIDDQVLNSMLSESCAQYGEYTVSQMNEDALKQITAVLPKLQGWCSQEKAAAMANLIFETRPKVVVEIGVYGGSSLIPQAIAMKAIGNGHVWGIDPWSRGKAVEGVAEDVHVKWWSNVDLEEIHRGYLKSLLDLKLTDVCTTLRCEAERAVHMFEHVDILHIDGNHSEIASVRDVTLWLPLLSAGGYVWFDDAAWDQPQAKALRMVADSCDHVRDIGTCALYRKK